MFRSRAAAGVFATAALVVVSLLGATPANAAPLPPGATIDVIGEDGGVYSVNSTTAVGSVVGTPSGVAAFTAIDVNQSGQGYAIALEDSGSFLYPVNAVTGTFGTRVPILNGGNEMTGCQGIDLSNDGVLIVSCAFEQETQLISLIGLVNPLSGEFHGITDFVTQQNDIVRSLASNSAGTFYYFTEFGQVFTLNTTTGESTPAGTVAGRILGADFDITDQLWVTLGAEGEEPITGNSLATVNVTSGVISPIAEYSSPGIPDFSTVMITVWGGLIANTGSSGAEYVPIAIGAALLLLAGVALGVTHHISHRRRTPAP